MKTFALAILTSLSFRAGMCEVEQRSVLWARAPERVMTGNLRVDLFSRGKMDDVPFVSPQDEGVVRRHKSPYLAAGLSLAVPGAGEFYTEHYFESVAFFAADVAAWLLAYHYDKKGDTQTDFFQNYADAHWNVVQYALFSVRNYIPQSEQGNYHWLIPGTEGRLPWLRINWGELNRMEQAIGGTVAGQYYSHVLPLHGDQQYYELIGKYQEFYQGWDDADSTLITYNQISQRLADGPTNMNYYSIERGKANNYYNTASAWVAVAIVNHVVNAAYAAFTAKWYNSAQAEMGLQRVPTEEGYTNVPVLKLKWQF